MTLRCWFDSAELEEEVRAGCADRSAIVSARAHPHMPRRRKSPSPLRASTGSGSPSAALRKVSYRAVIDAGGSPGLSVTWQITLKFFFHSAHARSSSGVLPDRTDFESR